MLVLLVFATGFGWWVGSRAYVGATARRYGQTIMLGAIGLLLFSMGISLGMRPEIVSRMTTIGLKAASLSLAGATGAILCVTVARRLVRRRHA
jgi:hypothetical protein